jgi:hypothetical protein
MLTGRLPYGIEVPRTRTRSQQRRLRYISAIASDGSVPDWIDGALRQAVHPDPSKRYEELSEFLYDLRHPNPAFVNGNGVPLYRSNPLRFWRVLSFLLTVMVLYLFAERAS